MAIPFLDCLSPESSITISLSAKLCELAMLFAMQKWVVSMLIMIACGLWSNDEGRLSG